MGVPRGMDRDQWEAAIETAAAALPPLSDEQLWTAVRILADPVSDANPAAAAA